MNSETIAAIATGLTNAGISIIRISGPESFSTIEKIFKLGKGGCRGYFNSNAVESHTVHYGCIVDNDTVIDEVMVLIFKNPASYTREDVIEIDCHGGITVTKRILEIVLKSGVRIAEPGEFTKRAFLNGRIDLSQAEAVINVINAKNKMALDNSMKQLGGAELKVMSKIRESILHDTAFIEAALDDPEHISLDGFTNDLLINVENNILKIDKLIKSSENGRLMSEGINTCLVGKPNAGKSTLLNSILGEERAIVTDIEGTTRDTLEETVSFGGITLKIIDTAGIRKTENIIEQIGVDRSLKAVKDADLVLYVVDSSKFLDDNDKKIMEMIKDKKCIIILNKTDLDVLTDDKEFINLKFPCVCMSAKNNEGLDELSDVIKNMFFSGQISLNDEICITSLRHKECLIEAKKALLAVTESINNDMPEDFFTIDLMNAYTNIGFIIGEETDEDLINKIFKEFCMGK